MVLIPEYNFFRYDVFGNQQKVTVSSFYMAKKTVTIFDWETYLVSINKDVNEWNGKVLRSLDDYSVTQVDPLWPAWYFTWIEAIQYCNWLSLKEGFIPCYSISPDKKIEWKVVWNRKANGYRLPTVAEWQLTSEICSEKLTIDKVLSQNSLYENNTTELPLRVGSLPPNTFGLFDMLGNIRIFCWDYYYPDDHWTGSIIDPIGPKIFEPDGDELYFHELLHETRVVAGGMWATLVNSIFDYPLEYTVSGSTGFVGMRVVRNK